MGAAGLAGGMVDVASALAPGNPIHHRELGVGPADGSSHLHDVRALGHEGQRGQRCCGGRWNGGRRGGRRRGCDG